MRIAVSGTHASGKTTLIEMFLSSHPRFAFEPEPYVVLQEIYGEAFAERPDVDDFARQLAVNKEALARYEPHDDVIFERCPADFVAYMAAVDETYALDPWIATARGSIARLDLIVFLPLDPRAPIEVAEIEDRELREAVDERLHDILVNDEFDLFAGGKPAVIEVRGSVEQRLNLVNRALDAART